MWSDDHRYHTGMLQEIQDEAERLLERAEMLLKELADDDYDGTEDSRARMQDGVRALESVAGAMEQAREQLPKAKVRPPLKTLRPPS